MNDQTLKAGLNLLKFEFVHLILNFCFHLDIILRILSLFHFNSFSIYSQKCPYFQHLGLFCTFWFKNWKDSDFVVYQTLFSFFLALKLWLFSTFYLKKFFFQHQFVILHFGLSAADVFNIPMLIHILTLTLEILV